MSLLLGRVFFDEILSKFQASAPSCRSIAIRNFGLVLCDDLPVRKVAALLAGPARRNTVFFGRSLVPVHRVWDSLLSVTLIALVGQRVQSAHVARVTKILMDENHHCVAAHATRALPLADDDRTFFNRNGLAAFWALAHSASRVIANDLNAVAAESVFGVFIAATRHQNEFI